MDAYPTPPNYTPLLRGQKVVGGYYCPEAAKLKLAELCVTARMDFPGKLAWEQTNPSDPYACRVLLDPGDGSEPFAVGYLPRCMSSAFLLLAQRATDMQVTLRRLNNASRDLEVWCFAELGEG